jgi:glycosyltransferase involved in cell wall biosynthesis
MRNGGAERQLGYLCAEQVRRGVEVHVALEYEGPNFERLRSSGATIHPLVGRGNHDPSLLWQLVRLCRRLRPDVVQTWLTQMDVLGGLAAQLSGVPWILSERSSSTAYPPTWKNRLRALVGRSASAVVANSTDGDAYWSARRGPHRLRRVIPNCPPQAPLDDGGARLEPLVEPGHKMVLYVGRLDPVKNLPNLILAVEHASARVPLRAYLCGDGSSRETTEQLIRERGLDHKVRLAGYVSNVWSWMKRADVFVSVSEREGCPNAVIEAALCDCPLVLSDISAHRELVTDRGAFFAGADSPQSIAEAIVRALVDRGETAERVRAARASVHSLSAAEIAHRYQDVYEAVIAAARRARV